MGNYTRMELDAMKHSRIKTLAITKCRQLNKASSWVQSAKQYELIDFLVDNKVPTPPEKSTPTPPPTPQPARAKTRKVEVKRKRQRFLIGFVTLQ